MAWVELLESHGGAFDSLGKGGVRRRFRCWNGVTVAAILQDPGSISNDAGQFLPVPGSPHPDYIDQSMVLDHYECETESVTILAVAIYSNISGGGGIPYNPDKRIGTSYERRKTDLWFGSKSLLDKQPMDPEPLIRWTMRPMQIIENFMRLTYRTIVPKKDPYDPNKPSWDGKAMEAIRAAIGEIHRFGFDGAPPYLWQFSGADVADRNLDDAVTVTYAWLRDPGTPAFYIKAPPEDPKNPDSPDDPANSFVWPPADKPDGFGNKFVRPPFEVLLHAIDLGGKKDKDGKPIPPTYKPIFFTAFTGTLNDDGWKSLPGLTP